MNVVVLGAGAVGGLFGGRLAAAGNHVTLVARPNHVQAIRQGGLRIEGSSPGSWPLEATSDLSAAGPADSVLLTVKTFDLEAAARELGRTLGPTPTLLPQNGLGIEPPVLAALRTSGWARPEDSVVRAVHSVPALWVGPGVVRATGTGEVILPTPGGRGALAGPIELFKELLRGAGLTVRTSSDIDREVWRKALLNAAINPVTALHGVPNGRLIDGSLRSEAVALLTEARAVARAQGFVFGEAEADAGIRTRRSGHLREPVEHAAGHRQGPANRDRGDLGRAASAGGGPRPRPAPHPSGLRRGPCPRREAKSVIVHGPSRPVR